MEIVITDEKTRNTLLSWYEPTIYHLRRAAELSVTPMYFEEDSKFQYRAPHANRSGAQTWKRKK